jgi:hypothetical protein
LHEDSFFKQKIKERKFPNSQRLFIGRWVELEVERLASFVCDLRELADEIPTHVFEISHTSAG